MKKEALVRPPVEETCASYIPESMRGGPSIWDLPERPAGGLDERTDTDLEEDDGGSFLYLYLYAGGLSTIAATLLATGSFATAKVDQVLGTHIGNKLEHIQPNKKDAGIEEFVKDKLHKIGQGAVREENKK
jgi:hypothetical protein